MKFDIKNFGGLLFAGAMAIGTFITAVSDQKKNKEIEKLTEAVKDLTDKNK